MVVVITRIMTPLWCKGCHPAKYFKPEFIFPLCYVQMTQCVFPDLGPQLYPKTIHVRFDDASFREEFINISGFADSDVPPLSQSEPAKETKEILESITEDIPRIIQATRGSSHPHFLFFHILNHILQYSSSSTLSRWLFIKIRSHTCGLRIFQVLRLR